MWKSLSLSVLALAALQTTSTSVLALDTVITKPAPTYLIVTRQDTRKCVYPVCGGYFVKAVNQALLRCADGVVRNECHAVDINSSDLPWTDEERDAFNGKFGAGQAIALGTLSTVPVGGYLAHTLTVVEGWLGQAESKPTGTFYGVKDSGIVCITYPCPTLTATTLNTRVTRPLAGIDLAASGATEKEVDAGYQALFEVGILAAGRNRVITGPAGRGRELVTSEFYLRVGAATP